jgi:hypothetical protein
MGIAILLYDRFAALREVAGAHVAHNRYFNYLTFSTRGSVVGLTTTAAGPMGTVLGPDGCGRRISPWPG